MSKAAAVVNPEKKTYAFLILDKSGSMGYCLKPTIMGFNEQVQTIKSDSKDADAGEWHVSRITFNQKVDVQQWCESPDTLEELTEENYVPNGSTAMLDAVGGTLVKIKSSTPWEDPNVSYLIVIVSDGQENASREYDYAKVGELIQELQATKRFTFTYMGSNQDLAVITDQLHIPVGNTALYKSDAAGTAHAFKAATRSTKEYMRSRKVGLCSVDSFYSSDGKSADLTNVPEEKKDGSSAA